MLKIKYPVQVPVIDDLHNAYVFNHAEGEDELSFVKTQYQLLVRDNKKQFSALCNQAAEIAQLKRQLKNYEDAIKSRKLVEADRIRIKLTWEVE